MYLRGAAGAGSLSRILIRSSSLIWASSEDRLKVPKNISCERSNPPRGSSPAERIPRALRPHQTESAHAWSGVGREGGREGSRGGAQQEAGWGEGEEGGGCRPALVQQEYSSLKERHVGDEKDTSFRFGDRNHDVHRALNLNKSMLKAPTNGNVPYRDQFQAGGSSKPFPGATERR